MVVPNSRVYLLNYWPHWPETNSSELILGGICSAQRPFARQTPSKSPSVQDWPSNEAASSLLSASASPSALLALSLALPLDELKRELVWRKFQPAASVCSACAVECAVGTGLALDRRVVVVAAIVVPVGVVGGVFIIIIIVIGGVIAADPALALNKLEGELIGRKFQPAAAISPARPIKVPVGTRLPFHA